MLNTYIEPRLELLKEKKLLGCKLKMSIISNKTSQLWGQFGPKIKNIKNIKNKFNSDKFSLQVYDAGYHSNFNPENEFEKWALVEVKNFDEIPRGLEPFTLVGGEYAVFDYKGSSSDTRIYQYIFMTWLPNSNYHLDNRPHFEVLGEKYKNNDPTSEEEIWLPIKAKTKAEH